MDVITTGWEVEYLDGPFVVHEDARENSIIIDSHGFVSIMDDSLNGLAGVQLNLVDLKNAIEELLNLNTT